MRVRTLRRAAQILGGPAQLRKYLNVSALCLAAWMTGVDTAPTRDDLPDVTDFADYGGGATDGDWGGGNSSEDFNIPQGSNAVVIPNECNDQV